ncbi:uncharacterized protein LOC142556886 [Primulina tabacum]|uniref:uncharacterized protein LOC142556886 n=1 Tax=Primulina tabacum TaxID=48773 RepID=UPI003F5A144E
MEEKPPKFSGNDFKQWQQKMLFYLTTLSLSRFFKEDSLVIAADDNYSQRRSVVDAWNHSDFLCRNYILNGLDDMLYSVYCSVKELWDSLEKKYKTEDAGVKKFVVGKFLYFKMVDNKSVVNQVQEIQIIIYDLLAEGMDINEPFQVAAIIEKLPPMWKDFKNYLKHKHNELKLEDLIVRLRIEEDSRTSEAKTHRRAMEAEAKANMTESSTNHKRKHPTNEKKRGQAKKFKGTCYNCGKPNHMAKDYRLPRKDHKHHNIRQANVIEDRNIPIELSQLDLSAVVFETNLVDNPREWWVDTGSTSTKCVEKEMFSSYTTVSDRKLFMGNSTTRS